MEKTAFELMLTEMGYELSQHPVRDWEYEVSRNGMATNMALNLAAIKHFSAGELRSLVLGICEGREASPEERGESGKGSPH